MGLEILEEWTVDNGSIVQYGCSGCDKIITKPKHASIKRIGKNMYKILEVYCSDECKDNPQGVQKR